ncbi:hypothetical protein FBQ81_07260 [Chloroflexi bacterium CFX6]|nr:hypothetical protein [Chloroflexi bacterium CFX6]
MNTSPRSSEFHLSSIHTLSVVIAALMTLLSLAGLFFQPLLYPTQELQRAFVANDMVNLFIGLPVLLVSLSLYRRGKLIGSLFLPGALLYVTYNYLAYLIATWLAVQSLFYAALVGLSAVGVFQILASVDKESVRQRLHGAVPERFAGGVLMVFGLLFFFRGSGQVYSAFTESTSFFSPEMSVVYADLITTPLWIIGGWLLWRRQALGYISAGGLLCQASLLFIGLLVFFIVQPFLTGAPFPPVDFVVILVMGMFFFIPLGLFVRGVLSTD